MTQMLGIFSLNPKLKKFYKKVYFIDSTSTRLFHKKPLYKKLSTRPFKSKETFGTKIATPISK